MKQFYRRTPLIAALLAAFFLVAMTPAVAQTAQCPCGPVCKFQHKQGMTPGDRHVMPTPQVPTNPGHASKSWEMLGPEGGTMVGIVSDPADVNVATMVSSFARVYHTTDGGANWTQIGQIDNPDLAFYPYGFASSGVDKLYVSGSYTDFITSEYGFTVMYSIDGGVTWARATVTGLPVGYNYMWNVSVDPVDPNTVYACGEFMDGYTYEWSAYFYKSTDAGANFTASATGLPIYYGNAVEAAPSNTATLYYVGYDLDWYTYDTLPKCYKSTDGGATWTDTSGGFPIGEPLFCVTVDPIDENHVYVGGLNLWETTDGGATWTETTGFTQLSHIVLDGANMYVADYSGFFCSFDGGTTWAFTAMPGASYVEIAPAAPTTTLHCTCMDTGVFKSVDLGVTWNNICNGILESIVYGLEVSESSPNRVYASPYGFSALLVSQDSGDTWTEIGIPPEGTYVDNTLESSAYPNVIMTALPGG